METNVIVTPEPIAGSAENDQALSQALLDDVAAGRRSRAVRIWRPVPALALTRLDQLRPGASMAAEAAARAGFPVVRRISGGHAVVAGRGSLCAGFAEPAPTFENTQERYRTMVEALLGALAELGIAAEQGELEGEWCPGAWSIRSGPVKLAGLSQRAIKGGAWVEAVLELEPDPAARDLLYAVYTALGLPLDMRTLGSLSEVLGSPVPFERAADALARRRASPQPTAGAAGGGGGD